jgi:hypothetical protein
MRRAKIVRLGALLLFTGATLLGGAIGCSSDPNAVSPVELSPEGKKGNESLKDGMKDFMQSKTKGKTPGKG